MSNKPLNDKPLNEYYVVVIPETQQRESDMSLHLIEVRLKLIEDGAAFVETLNGATKVIPQEWLIALYDYYPADYACSFTGVNSKLDMEE